MSWAPTSSPASSPAPLPARLSAPSSAPPLASSSAHFPSRVGSASCSRAASLSRVETRRLRVQRHERVGFERSERCQAGLEPGSGIHHHDLSRGEVSDGLGCLLAALLIALRGVRWVPPRCLRHDVPAGGGPSSSSDERSSWKADESPRSQLQPCNRHP